MSMLNLFLLIVGISAGLVILVAAAVYIITKSVKFLSKEEEERENEEYFRPKLRKTEDEEEMFL